MVERKDKYNYINIQQMQYYVKNEMFWAHFAQWTFEHVLTLYAIKLLNLDIGHISIDRYTDNKPRSFSINPNYKILFMVLLLYIIEIRTDHHPKFKSEIIK